MSRRIILCFSIACSFRGALTAADPFVGKWKLDQAQSKFAGDREVIQDLGGNKYKITVGADSWTMLLDGTDQSSPFGVMRSWKQTSPNAWFNVHKQDGKITRAATVTLSNDATWLTTIFESTRPDGTKATGTYKQKRVAGTNGLAGTWESAEFRDDSSDQLDIRPYDSDGLSFLNPAFKEKQDMKFDGNYYPDIGPNVAAGSTSSAKRTGDRTIKWIDKVKDEIVDHQELRVSGDGRTLTFTIQNPRNKKSQVVVYNRQ